MSHHMNTCTLLYNLEYPSCMKYFDINSKHFREEKDFPKEILKNLITYAVTDEWRLHLENEKKKKY